MRREGRGGQGESETFRVYLADAAGQTEFRFKSWFLQLTFPKVNNSTKILNEKKTEQHFLEKEKHKGERQHHRKEAEEGSTTHKEREKVLFQIISIKMDCRWVLLASHGMFFLHA